jgi:hypothetical protein
MHDHPKINTLVQLLESQGSWFHNDMRIKVSNNAVSIFSNTPSRFSKKWLHIPLSCMPLLRDYQFDVDSHLNLVASPGSANIQTIRVMEAILDIYNNTRKLESWKQSCPLFCFKHTPEILYALGSLRPKAHKLNRYMAYIAVNNFDNLLIESFLGSRTFNLKKDQLSKVGMQTDIEAEEVLLPVIDFFNHKATAAPYDIEDDYMKVSGRPDPDTGEIFVRYNQYDPVDTYLFYGFVDTTSPWLYSMPLKLKFSDNHIIEIMGVSASFKGQPPRQMHDLRMYMPALMDRRDKYIQVSRLAIPGRTAPMSLKRILASLLRSMDNTLSQDQLIGRVKDMELFLVAENLKFWQDLEKHAQLANNHDLNELCRFCVNHIREHQRVITQP